VHLQCLFSNFKNTNTTHNGCSTFEEFVDDSTIFPNFIAVPEESGSHVVIVGDKRLLMAADAPETAETLRDLGYFVIEVDISEFIKLEGCVTCLSVRIR
jgi:dimethylargininase